MFNPNLYNPYRNIKKATSLSQPSQQFQPPHGLLVDTSVGIRKDDQLGHVGGAFISYSGMDDLPGPTSPPGIARGEKSIAALARTGRRVSSRNKKEKVMKLKEQLKKTVENKGSNKTAPPKKRATSQKCAPPKAKPSKKPAPSKKGASTKKSAPPKAAPTKKVAPSKVAPTKKPPPVKVAPTKKPAPPNQPPVSTCHPTANENNSTIADEDYFDIGQICGNNQITSFNANQNELLRNATSQTKQYVAIRNRTVHTFFETLMTDPDLKKLSQMVEKTRSLSTMPSQVRKARPNYVFSTSVS